jgi:hypothetical protein
MKCFQDLSLTLCASHHAWTHPLSACSQQTVLDARKTIRDQVADWLK